MNDPIQSSALTPAQQALALEVIAGRMNTLNRLLMALQTNNLDACEEGTLVDAAQFMAQAVGALADDAVGGGVCGDMRYWFYGAAFAREAAPRGAV